MNEKVKEIYERLREVLKDKKGIKKKISGAWVHGFLVALVDYKVITEEEYKEIRDLLISEFGYFF